MGHHTPLVTGAPMPALPSCLLEPLWSQFSALLPTREMENPGRPRIPDRVIFDKLIAMLRFSCTYREVADRSCSATTLRRRRDEWLSAGVFSRLEEMVRSAYERLIGLDLEDVSIDGCITKAPCGGECG